MPYPLSGVWLGSVEIFVVVEAVANGYPIQREFPRPSDLTSDIKLWTTPRIRTMERSWRRQTPLLGVRTFALGQGAVVAYFPATAATGGLTSPITQVKARPLATSTILDLGAAGRAPRQSSLASRRSLPPLA